MNKKIKSILAVSVASTMLFSACGSADTSSSSSDSSSSASADTAADDNSIFTENGTYPIVKEGEEYSITVFAPLRSGVSSYEVEDNEFSAWLEEKTGITIEWQTCASADRETKLNTLMTSGTYPDVILDHFWSTSAQLLYGEQGIILPLNDLIAEYGPNIQAALDENPATANYATLEDGQMYSLMSIGTATHMLTPNKMWINETWLDNLGLDMPTTTDELETVLIAFRDQDANGNGDASDEVPLSGSLYGWNTDTFKALMNSFTYYDGTNMYVEDGTVIYTKTTDGWKEGLKWFASLAEQGLVDPLYFSQSSDDYKSLADNSNGTMVGLGAGGSVSTMITIGDSDRWLEYSAMAPLEGPEGVQNAIYSPSYGYAVGAITETCEYPEAVIRMFDVMYTLEGYMGNARGIYGTDYVDAEEGDLNFIGEPATYYAVTADGERDGRYWNQLGPWYRPADNELLFSTYEGDIEGVLYNATVNSYLDYIPALEDIVPTNLTFDTDESRIITDIVTTLNTAVDAYTAQFAMGTKDVEAEWDTYVAELDALGLQEWLAVYQEAVTENLAK
ncbi:MAG: extracellular solute-binding protein [Lachnospiraceae bacterium]